jgi:hypothetical protein
VSIYDVRTFGAVGDGVADDTNAIQDATTAAAGGGGTVVFPAGAYSVRRTIQVDSKDRTKSVILRGAGAYQSTVLPSSLATGSLFEVVAPANVTIASLTLHQASNGQELIRTDSCDNLMVYDCALEGDPNTTAALVYSSCARTNIAQCSLIPRNEFSFGIRLRKANHMNIESRVFDCFFAGEGKGIIVDKESAATLGQVEGLRIRGTTFMATGAEIITIRAGYYIEIIGNTLDQTRYAGIRYDAQDGQVDGVTIAHNYIGFKGVGNEVAILDAGGPYGVVAVIINGNRIAGGTYGIGAAGNADRWVVSSNVLDGDRSPSSQGIGLGSTGQFVVMGNIVSSYRTPFNNAAGARVAGGANVFN